MTLMTKQSGWKAVTIAVSWGVVVASLSATLPAGAESQAKPYSEHVQCEQDDASGQKKCRIDLYLTRGFRAFSQCQVCHGLDGTGSSFAPSLIETMREIGKDRFMEVVANGYKGQIGVMPGWKENPNVMNYVDHLYLYLLARADGAIPAGKIERYDR